MWGARHSLGLSITNESQVQKTYWTKIPRKHPHTESSISSMIPLMAVSKLVGGVAKMVVRGEHWFEGCEA